MNGYFAFDCNIDDPKQARRDFRFLFKPPGALRQGDLSDAIERSSAGVLAPDGIAIVCVEDEVRGLVAAIGAKAGLQQASNRLTTRITLCICCIDSDGQIQLKTTVRNEAAGDEGRFQAASGRIFEAGLLSLFTTHHVLVTSPPGFTFVKPSGERSTQFLRAEDALTDVENVQFLSFSILRKLRERHDALQRPIDVICIDTMAIASVAYALRDLYCAMFNAPKPRVVSFHSHDGLQDFDYPLFGTSFCIISASSSMRLERVWREKSQCHPTEVLTLVTFANAVDAGRALFALPSPARVETAIEGLRDIRMAGERFAPEDLKPRKVLLRKEKHEVPTASEFSKFHAGGSRLVIQGKLPLAGAKVRPIFVVGEQLAQAPEFLNFLNKVLRQKVPVTVGAIIYQDDTGSQLIASKCADYIRPRLNVGSQLQLIPHSQLEEKKASIDTDSALLIVAAVVGRGSKLLAISRDLRPIHTGARTYVIGAQIAETQAQISALSGNLKYSAAGALIHVALFSHSAIGESLPASYKREHHYLSGLALTGLTERLAHRVEKLAGTSSGMNKDALLPMGGDLNDDLVLRPDFAYWGFKYEDRQSTTPAVLLTIAAILQRARESAEVGHANRLGTDAFQQVVLDPENFARYNDGVIQGALLRAALPGELDYSSEREASRYMFDLVSKIIVQHEQPQGEAAPEFALAWKTGALKFSKEHHEALLPLVAPSLQGGSRLKRLLRILLGIEASPVEASLPAEF